MNGRIVSSSDGDTLRARFGSHIATIRLVCIGAPELKQKPWGEQSRDRLRQLLPVGEITSF
ncbi:MAG: hypothetical protein WBB28_08025 [Crinalium sp.]